MTPEEQYQLPEWEKIVDEAEEPSQFPTAKELYAAKELFHNWKELYNLILAFSSSLPEDGEREFFKEKIENYAAEVGQMMIETFEGILPYYLKMERAAVMRYCCSQLIDFVDYAMIATLGDKEYQKIIVDGIDSFRLLFITWVATLEKDEEEDEWGMF